MFLLHKVLRVTSRSPACCDPRPWTWCAATFDKKYWSQPWMDIQILKESNKSHSSLSFEVILPHLFQWTWRRFPLIASPARATRVYLDWVPGWLFVGIFIRSYRHNNDHQGRRLRLVAGGYWDWMAMRYSISNIINNRNDFHDHELRQFAWSGAHTAARRSQLITSLGGKWANVEYFQLIS